MNMRITCFVMPHLRRFFICRRAGAPKGGGKGQWKPGPEEFGEGAFQGILSKSGFFCLVL
ncbi:MAG: hypothetical protein CW342_10825 [Thermoactinomycetaceae bacterium]|jgi:hypothetical protein|nr:hypothetical protein [Bacillota bacterium]MBO2533358.1 hypothetical protein [Thermoactinomycetaceae bacterium]